MIRPEVPLAVASWSPARSGPGDAMGLYVKGLWRYPVISLAGEPPEMVEVGPERFDVLPLLLATDGAVAEFGRHLRRLRPRVLIGEVAGMDEREWEGNTLGIGGAGILLDSLHTSRWPSSIPIPWSGIPRCSGRSAAVSAHGSP